MAFLISSEFSLLSMQIYIQSKSIVLLLVWTDISII